MKKMCFVVFVYGEKYQGYIPLYIYSILKNYPEYDIRVYIDGNLNDTVKGKLSTLSMMGNYEVIENYAEKHISPKMNIINKNHIRKLRWLIFEEIMLEYEAVYMGDIDIFICKEELEIFEQHRRHCEVLGLPYSNYLRTGKQKMPKTLKYRLYSVYKNGLKKTVQLYNNSFDYKRLSGLHFVLTKPYYDKINSKLDELITEFKDIIKNDEFTIDVGDESFLYNIIEKSGLELPPVCAHGPINDPNAFNCVGFRPHHGIHLGIFRNEITIDAEIQVLKSKLYKDYYNQFISLKNNDPIFAGILDNLPEFIDAIISRMESFYSESN